MNFTLQIEFTNLGKKIFSRPPGLKALDEARRLFPDKKIENVIRIQGKLYINHKQTNQSDLNEIVDFVLNTETVTKGVMVFSVNEQVARRLGNLFLNDSVIGVVIDQNFDSFISGDFYTVESLLDSPTVGLLHQIDMDKLIRAIKSVRNDETSVD